MSHFRGFTKVDVFYISAADLKPSPWLALPIHILHDPTGAVEAAVANSELDQKPVALDAIEQVVGKSIASAIEVARRVARGEFLYAQTLIAGLRSRAVALEDILEERRPGLNSSIMIEDRISPQLRDALYAACPCNESADFHIALARLLKALRNLINQLYGRGKLSRSPAHFLRALDSLDGDA